MTLRRALREPQGSNRAPRPGGDGVRKGRQHIQATKGRRGKRPTQR
jgi:hypothetical protein